MFGRATERRPTWSTRRLIMGACDDSHERETVFGGANNGEQRCSYDLMQRRNKMKRPQRTFIRYSNGRLVIRIDGVAAQLAMVSVFAIAALAYSAITPL